MTLPEVAARAPLTKAAETVDKVYHKVPTQHIATAIGNVEGGHLARDTGLTIQQVVALEADCRRLVFEEAVGESCIP